MLKFQFTCPRHQRVFIEAAKRGGCLDLEKLDAIRRKTLAWLSTTYPRAVLDHFNEGACMGCKLEADGIGTADAEVIITKLAAELG